jgi:hypothetical protein
MQPHRAFIIASLALCATIGTSFGIWMVLGWLGVLPLVHFTTILAAHAQLQVYGFVGLYTMGVAMMVLPTFLNTKLQPAWLAVLSLLFMLGGIGLNLRGPTLPGGIMQSFSTLSFLFVLRITRKSAPERKAKSTPLTKGHAIFLATGSMWLMACPLLALWDSTKALETVLWGFAGLFIAGIGLRVHTGILGIKGVHGQLLLPSAALWNLGLLLRWTGPRGLWVWTICAGIGLFLWALRPFRKPFIPPAGGAWLRYFVRTSYFWLIIALALACASEFGYSNLAGPARHMLGVGFIITMMMGMGMRMIPAFETKRIPWRKGPWFIYGLVTLGTAVRIPAQAANEMEWLFIGGGLQFLGIISFVSLMMATYLFGEVVKCDLDAIPPEKIFQDENAQDSRVLIQVKAV